MIARAYEKTAHRLILAKNGDGYTTIIRMPRNGESGPNASGQAEWGASVRAPLFVFSCPVAGLDVCLSAAERSDAALVSRQAHV